MQQSRLNNTSKLMRIPFPAALKVGTDIVHISRIEKVISKNNYHALQGFLKRVLHPLECRDFIKKFPEWRTKAAILDLRHEQAHSGRALSRWLSGRWAAKEAARKAWGATSLGFKDVRVEIHAATGEVQMVCHGEDLIKGSIKQAAEQVAQLSISHDGDYAMATVLATPLQLKPVGQDEGQWPLGESLEEAPRRATSAPLMRDVE